MIRLVQVCAVAALALVVSVPAEGGIFRRGRCHKACHAGASCATCGEQPQGGPPAPAPTGGCMGKVCPLDRPITLPVDPSTPVWWWAHRCGGSYGGWLGPAGTERAGDCVEPCEKCKVAGYQVRGETPIFIHPFYAEYGIVKQDPIKNPKGEPWVKLKTSTIRLDHMRGPLVLQIWEMQIDRNGHRATLLVGQEVNGTPDADMPKGTVTETHTPHVLSVSYGEKTFVVVTSAPFKR
jgi:hypothetical protein